MSEDRSTESQGLHHHHHHRCESPPDDSVRSFRQEDEQQQYASFVVDRGETADRVSSPAHPPGRPVYYHQSDERDLNDSTLVVNREAAAAAAAPPPLDTPISGNDCLSIHKNASARMLTNDGRFKIKSADMDSFAEHLQKQFGSKDLLEFYLACVALQRIPDDDDFLKKSIKSIYRLFIRKYIRCEAGELRGKYVSLATLRRIADDVTILKVYSKNAFQPAFEELIVLLSRYYTEFDDRAKKTNEAGCGQPSAAAAAATTDNQDTEDDMNGILDDHCNRVFKNCSTAPRQVRRVDTQVLADRHRRHPHDHAEFTRSVSTLWTGRKADEQRQTRRNTPKSKLAPPRRIDDRLLLNATKRTFSGVQRSVLPHSKSVATLKSATSQDTTRQCPTTVARERGTAEATDQQQSAKNPTNPNTRPPKLPQKITIVYYLPGESIPFMTPHSSSTITLAQFKNSVVCKKLTNCKFFFKTKIDLDECQVVFKEVTDMDECLPLFDQKIIAKIETID